MSFCIFFFFQAEDGIRDTSVTGVQTCALPILRRVAVDAEGPAEDRNVHEVRDARAVVLDGIGDDPADDDCLTVLHHHRGLRSEERRVGKEGRCRWWRGQYRKKSVMVCGGMSGV